MGKSSKPYNFFPVTPTCSTDSKSASNSGFFDTHMESLWKVDVETRISAVFRIWVWDCIIYLLAAGSKTAETVGSFFLPKVILFTSLEELEVLKYYVALKILEFFMFSIFDFGKKHNSRAKPHQLVSYNIIHIIGDTGLLKCKYWSLHRTRFALKSGSPLDEKY